MPAEVELRSGHSGTCMRTDLMRDGCLAKTKLVYTTPRDIRARGPDIKLRSVHASGAYNPAKPMLLS